MALAVFVTSGCASRSLDAARISPHAKPTASAAASDPQLVGWWQLRTVYRTGQEPLHPDDLAPEYLRFRPDGRVVTAGDNCGTPPYSAANGRLEISWPHSFACSGFTSGDPIELQISKALERVQLREEISYAIDGTRLTLAAGGYRIEFAIADHRGQPTASLPGTWTPSSRPRAPRSPDR
jgi:hypothetical protein